MDTWIWIVLVLLGLVVLYFILRRRKARVNEEVKFWQSKGVRNWDAEFLESFRTHGDPLADGLVRGIFEKGEVDEINHLYASIRKNRGAMPSDLPSELKLYFKAGEQLPEWADQAMIAAGEAFFMRHSGLISYILLTRSLPYCYSCSKGAWVLYQTGRLNEQNGNLEPFVRRLAETSQFILDVMSPRGLSPIGSGIRSAQKIRLMHATIRYHLSKTDWDYESLGIPINQQDLAGTLMSFSPLILEGLELLGVNVSETDKESFVHCWRVVGYFIGLDEQLSPNNYQDALAMGYAILDNQQAASAHGTQLTHVILDFLNKLGKGGIIEGISLDMMHLMLGEKTAEMLQLPKVRPLEAKLSNEVLKLISGWENFESRSSILRLISMPLNRMLMTELLGKMSDHEQIAFYIPTTLKG